MSKQLTNQFKEFISNHSPVQVSRHLRCILMDYIAFREREGLPVDFKIYLWELSDLFDLLDMAADEMKE